MRALLLALLVAGSALAFVPSAAATPPCAPDEGSYCPPPPPTVDPDCNKVPDRPAVEVTADCKVIVTLDLFSCPLGEDDITTTIGPVTIVRDQCRAPTSAPAMADPFPTCVRECSPVPMEACALRDATPENLRLALWGLDCTLDVETSCLGGSSDSLDARIGFVNVSLARCDGPDWS